jgi:hypothetical protein
MTATSTKQDSKGISSSYQLVMTDDADTQDYDISQASKVAISVEGITSDEVKIYVSAIPSPTSSDWFQIYDEADVNPFTEDETAVLEVAAYQELRIERSGGSDGDLTININFVK